MKKTMLLSVLFGCCLLCSAQKEKVVLKTGTSLELESAQTVLAREANEGDVIKFRVIGDVKQNGKVVVPAGTMAEARVIEAKKSSIAGTKGKLRMNFTNLIMQDGTRVPLSGNCNVFGKNRTPGAVISGLFVWPCIFIPGTKAVLVEGHRATATVFTNVDIEI